MCQTNLSCFGIQKIKNETLEHWNTKKEENLLKKENVPIVVSVVCGILVVGCWIRIGTLQNKIENMENNLVSQIYVVQEAVNGISYDVSHTLEQQASLLEDIQFTYQIADANQKTVQVTCQLVPKEYQEGITTAVLCSGEKEYPLTLQDNRFVGTFEIPLLENTKIDAVQFQEGATVRSQEIQQSIYPITDCLPQITALFYGENGIQKSGNGVIHTMNGEIEIRVDTYAEKQTVESIDMIEFMDKKEIKRTAIPLDSNTSQWNDEKMQSEPITEAIPAEYPTQFYYLVEQSTEVPQGSTYEVWIDVTDIYGFHHKVCLLQQGGTMESMDTGFSEQASIYDADGNVIYIP